MIRLESVCKIFPIDDGHSVTALAGVDLTIKQGEFVAVMGASGSGKSTLLNLMGCLDRPSGGRCVVMGVDTAELDDRRLSRLRGRSIGFVFQAFHLIPGLTVVENVEVPLLYSHRSRRERRRRALGLLDEVGLADRAEHRVATLSGGEQQRAAIARAVANDPAVVLADEPTGSVDAQAANAIVALLRGMNRTGRTVVVVTHNPGVAAQARRLVRISNGRVLAVEAA
ncbi:MAG TPA: ABC transporter ATP-binding protein [Candidatus Angelobacter sp.]|jgi:ABC-type lipoprotein export system ATPase subunit|nr:ABC transporter ATP-binding protein [Candidatus Angelobacter sp.]